MAYNKKSKRILSFGASMMEFTIGFPVVILCIVFLVDTGLYLFQRSLLTDGTAAMSRQIVTTLGQRHANCAISATPPCNCDQLTDAATAKKLELVYANPELYPDYAGTTFHLEIDAASSSAPIIEPYRLVILTVQRQFKCLTCKFFPITLNMTHKSVMVLERPTSNGCAEISDRAI